MMMTEQILCGEKKMNKEYMPRGRINPIDPKCPYKPRSIIGALWMTIPFYNYMRAMYDLCKTKREQMGCHKTRGNPTIPNAYFMARSGWR